MAKDTILDPFPKKKVLALAQDSRELPMWPLLYGKRPSINLITHRRLLPMEILRRGDEYFWEEGGEWMPTGKPGTVVGSGFCRRKI